MMLQDAMMGVARNVNVVRLLHRSVVEDGLAAEAVPRELLQALERGGVQVVHVGDVVQLVRVVGEYNEPARPFYCVGEIIVNK